MNYKYTPISFAIIFVALLLSFNVEAKDATPDPVTWEKNVKTLLYDENVKIEDGSNIMQLETPYRALDAAIVPVTVKFNHNQQGDKYIKSLVLVVDENPSPIVSKFNLTPKMGNASITTRIRIDKYTYVRAIAEMNTGEKLMVANYVKAAGGCSAPSLADMDAVMARLGKMKMKFLKTSSREKISEAEFLISHPNYSGLQFNQLTRAEIPAHFVNYVKVEQDDELIFEAFPDISLSEDPSFTFNYINSGGSLNVIIEDSEGAKFSKEFALNALPLN